MKKKTILIVDDTISNLDILLDILTDYDVIDAISGEDALELVENENVDLILLDIMMPVMDGFEVCRRLKENNQTKYIPVIFITAITDENNIEKAYDIGGSDYVTKPFKPKELLSRVKRELQIQTLIYNLKNKEEELKQLAATDSLSKLYNRRYFSKISENIFAFSKRESNPLSLIMIDIDNFKKINDNFGHNTGDKVIIDISQKLLNTQRKSDIICRFGGEEFVVLLPNTKLEDAKNIAEKIRFILENNTLNINEVLDIKYTISSGVSNVDFSKDENIEAVLKRADEALYLAKNNGKNQVQIKGV